MQAGTLLQNRYEIVRLIARGGMGAVYEAVDQRLGNTVALKETLVNDPQLRQAFEREARLLAGLNHPVLPGVKDHFTEDDGQFLVMDFIPGKDLAGLLEQRTAPFPVDEVLAWAADLLDALDYLHSQQPPIIHRDIKPQNLKLNQRGRIVLLDFGLARGARPVGSQAGVSTGQAASIFGYTPQYAPIEQIQGSGTAPPSDLYSLAATLFQLLSNQPPPDALTRASATVSGQPDPLPDLSSLNPQVNPALGQVLQRAMAQNPQQRFASAPEMLAALKAAAGGQAPAPASSAGIETVVVANQPPAAAQPPVDPTLLVAPASPEPSPPLPRPTQPTRPRWSLFDAPNPAVVAVRLAVGFVALVMMLIVSCGLINVFLPERVVNPPRPTANQQGSDDAAVAVPDPTRSADQPPTGREVPDDAGLSRAAPLPPDAIGRIDGWTVQVLEMIRGREAWNRIDETNQFADPAPEGMEYIIVRLHIQADFAGEESRKFYPKITGDRLRETAGPGVVSPDPALQTELVGGEQSEGWEVFLVGVDEGNLMLKLEELSAPADAVPRYLALEPGAAIAADPQLRDIEPNRIGLDIREPVAMGETAISEDWEVTLLEVFRGQEAWQIIEAAAGTNDPPVAGREYVLARFRVRSISTIDDTRMLTNNDFDSLPAGSTDPRTDRLQSPIVINVEPEIDSYLYPGGVSEGLVALLAPVDEQMVIMFSPGFLDSQNTRFFAVDSNEMIETSEDDDEDEEDDEGEDDD